MKVLVTPMKFRSGDYIYHNEYGVGKIEEGLEGTSDEVIVHFMDNQSMPMPTYLLERSVVKISPSGFRAFAY
jgi:transcription elongation factor GreA-like protein